MSDKKVTCPHCGEKCVFKRDSTGRWVGSIAGAGVGTLVFWGLGIVGAVVSFPVALGTGATIGGAILVGALGNRAGKRYDDNEAKCPSCEKSMVL
jgi:ribosomal protein L37AE/L43A